ncbi:DNA-protecting protein DprA [Caproiciproducens sp. NJN-50]|uniref:DNA-processing protein DprA n=1 Tax=Acutalibacteraceae TaxID=3082771 RepID=UPI000FFE2352|nr:MULTISPECIES: DNA-processing protein DprA [Acutalibacteraceae]QAT49774.1 DNA-protecting protein DprA [Caproiciproducens sp. NJN-50]
MSDYDPKAFWLWLQHALGAGSSKQNRILEGWRNLEDFYAAGREAWLLEGYFTAKELRGMETYSISDAQALLAYCEKIGQKVTAPDCDDYPGPLRQIHNPPCALYYKGILPDFSSEPAISIVGTRKATQTGKAAARSFAYELAQNGVVVVSGGALGIDTAAHQGALQAEGKTVCVLGCGIDTDYLMANASLRGVIAEKGALISEFPPQTQASGSNFPIRNRIISGLSFGTLVVEAAAKSGSLITADYALEQGRDVFAVPCGIFSPVSAGANNLIKSGAKPVSGAKEILEEYPEWRKSKFFLDDTKTNVIIEENSVKSDSSLENKKRAVPCEDKFSPDAQILLSGLTDRPCPIAELAEVTRLPAARLLSAVTELELEGAVESHSGRRYSLRR